MMDSRRFHGDQLVHATEKNLFARAPPFLIELAISEGQLMVNQ